MSNVYTPTTQELVSLNVLYDYCLELGAGFTDEIPSEAACNQALRLVSLGQSAFEFILTELDPDDAAWAQWQDIIEYLPH